MMKAGNGDLQLNMESKSWWGLGISHILVLNLLRVREKYALEPDGFKPKTFCTRYPYHHHHFKTSQNVFLTSTYNIIYMLTSLMCPEASLAFLLQRGCGFSKAVIRSTMETSISEQQGW